jgi:hypothetical protein
LQAHPCSLYCVITETFWSSLGKLVHFIVLGKEFRNLSKWSVF